MKKKTDPRALEAAITLGYEDTDDGYTNASNEQSAFLAGWVARDVAGPTESPAPPASPIPEGFPPRMWRDPFIGLLSSEKYPDKHCTTPTLEYLSLVEHSALMAAKEAGFNPNSIGEELKEDYEIAFMEMQDKLVAAEVSLAALAEAKQQGRAWEMVKRAARLLAEGKAKFAPHTTNSFVDDWLQDFVNLENESRPTPSKDKNPK